MSLVKYEVVYHLIDNPNKIYNRRLLTGDDPVWVDEYLIRQYGHGKVVLHYAERERSPIGREHTCKCCGCTRIVYEKEPRPLHPAVLDKSLWRML